MWSKFFDFKGWAQEKAISTEYRSNGVTEQGARALSYSWESGATLGKFNLISKSIIDRKNWLMIFTRTLIISCCMFLKNRNFDFKRSRVIFPYRQTNCWAIKQIHQFIESTVLPHHRRLTNPHKSVSNKYLNQTIHYTSHRQIKYTGQIISTMSHWKTVFQLCCILLCIHMTVFLQCEVFAI